MEEIWWLHRDIPVSVFSDKAECLLSAGTKRNISHTSLGSRSSPVKYSLLPPPFTDVKTEPRATRQ